MKEHYERKNVTIFLRVHQFNHVFNAVMKRIIRMECSMWYKLKTFCGFSWAVTILGPGGFMVCMCILYRKDPLAQPTVVLENPGIEPATPGPEVIKLEYSLKHKIKRNDWLLAATCPQAANHCALF